MLSFLKSWVNRAGLGVSGGGWGVRGPHAWQIVMKEVTVIKEEVEQRGESLCLE